MSLSVDLFSVDSTRANGSTGEILVEMLSDRARKISITNLHRGNSPYYGKIFVPVEEFPGKDDVIRWAELKNWANRPLGSNGADEIEYVRDVAEFVEIIRGSDYRSEDHWVYLTGHEKQHIVAASAETIADSGVRKVFHTHCYVR